MTAGSVRLTAFGMTDRGRARERNEDAFLVADLTTGTATIEPELRDHTVGPRGSLLLVADGMGGAAAGEVASRMAADVIFAHMQGKWASDPVATPERFAYRMKEAVDLANERIHAYAAAHPELRGMGTTLTAAGIYGTDLYVTQIGDSRGYLVRDSRAVQLTKDQSLTQRLIDAGELTEEEAEQSERRNIILQALGPDPRVRVVLTHQTLRRGDTLIICSDGLSGSVRREELGPMVTAHADLGALCAALIDLANARGGHDNITVVAARIGGEVLAEPDGGHTGADQAYDAGEPGSEADSATGTAASSAPGRRPPEAPLPAAPVAAAAAAAAPDPARTVSPAGSRHSRARPLALLAALLILLLGLAVAVWR